MTTEREGNPLFVEPNELNTQRLRALTHKLMSALLEEDRPMQALAMCDTIALWLAAHIGPKEEIDQFREGLIEMFVRCIKALVPINEKIIRDRAQQDETVKAIIEKLEHGTVRH